MTLNVLLVLFLSLAIANAFVALAFWKPVMEFGIRTQARLLIRLSRDQKHSWMVSQAPELVTRLQSWQWLVHGIWSLAIALMVLKGFAKTK